MSNYTVKYFADVWMLRCKEFVVRNDTVISHFDFWYIRFWISNFMFYIVCMIMSYGVRTRKNNSNRSTSNKLINFTVWMNEIKFCTVKPRIMFWMLRCRRKNWKKNTVRIKNSVCFVLKSAPYYWKKPWFSISRVLY